MGRTYQKDQPNKNVKFVLIFYISVPIRTKIRTNSQERSEGSQGGVWRGMS